MFSDFLVDVVVEFAVVDKDVFHFFDFFYDESVLFDEGLHGNSSTYEQFIDGYEIVQIFVVDKFLEPLDLVLEGNHLWWSFQDEMFI